AGLKGVLIVADSGDDSNAIFTLICKILSRDGPFDASAKFVRPETPFVVTAQPPGHLAISIMLLPPGGHGGLETICAESAFRRRPWLRECVQTYLQCGDISATNWKSECYGKSVMQCIIAALHKPDPNKTLRYLFQL